MGYPNPSGAASEDSVAARGAAESAVARSASVVSDEATEWLSFRASHLSEDMDSSSTRQTSDCYLQIFYGDRSLNLRAANDFGVAAVIGGTRTEVVRDSLSPAWSTPLPVPQRWPTPIAFLVAARTRVGINDEGPFFISFVCSFLLFAHYSFLCSLTR